ncbi:MAG: hypothetical protein ABSC06_31160 [Rhodopila sp.]|jgi:hypothetical protein
MVWFAGLGLGARAESRGDISASAADSWQPEFYLVLIFCFLGFVVLVMQFVLFMRSVDRVSPGDIMRSFSTILILISVVGLVGVGYSEQQVQPAYALIGTLLGYILGRGASGGDSQKPRDGPRSGDVAGSSDNERRGTDDRSDS